MHQRMKQAVGLALIGAVIAGAIVVPRDRLAWPLGMMRNYYLRRVFAPPRDIHTETAKDFVPVDLLQPSDENSPAEDWPTTAPSPPNAIQGCARSIAATPET